jgi:prolyl-tRNA synthetase
LGALIALHGDDKGLIIPPAIAPYQAIIVPIYYTEKEKIAAHKKAKEIFKNLEKSFRANIDLREEYTPGWKFNYWEMKGVPIRIEVGPKDIKKKQVVLVRRDNGKKIVIKEKFLEKNLSKLLESIQENLTKKADKIFRNNLKEAKNVKELKKILEEKGGLVKINWCGQRECADYIKSETNGGTIRGTIFGKKEKPKGNCLWCDKESKYVVYVAKQY